MKKISFLVSLILIVGLSTANGLDTESKFVNTKQDNVVVESNTLVEPNIIEKSSATKACENALPNGVHTEYHENGTLKSYQVIENANKNCPYKLKKGTHTEYHENGRLKAFRIIL